MQPRKIVDRNCKPPLWFAICYLRLLTSFSNQLFHLEITVKNSFDQRSSNLRVGRRRPCKAFGRPALSSPPESKGLPSPTRIPGRHHPVFPHHHSPQLHQNEDLEISQHMLYFFESSKCRYYPTPRIGLCVRSSQKIPVLYTVNDGHHTCMMQPKGPQPTGMDNIRLIGLLVLWNLARP